jgi:hypothetical protein
VTGAEALSRLEARGARIVLLPDEKIDITAPAGPETEALIDELAAHKPEAVVVLRARPLAHPCCDCGAEVGPELMLCASCHEARLERRKVIPFDPERRKVAVICAYFSGCSRCGAHWWRLNGRGDAWCVACWRATRRELAGGDTHGQGAPAIARPGESSREVPEPGGAV